MKTHTLPFNARRLTITTLVLTSLTLGFAPITQANDIKFSGFLSVGGGFVDDDKSIPYNGYSEEDLTFNNNLLGLQVTGTISDKLTATAQMIARSSDNYSLNSEWAYLTWQFSDNTKIRAGRLRTPFYMYSDSLDVGYSYAWITPPREVYNVPFNNVDGVDIYSTGRLGSFDTSIQAYFGGFEDDLNFNGFMAPTKSRNQIGVAATLGKDWWTLRAAYHEATVSIDVANAPLSATTTIGSFANTLTAFGFAKNADKLLIDEDKATFAEVGLNIDTGKFVAVVERIEFGAKETLLAKNIRQYIMGGVRFDDWLVHLTYSQSKDEALHPESGIPVGVALPVVGSTNVLIGTLQAIAQQQAIDRTVIGIGTRWDVTAGTALKFQIDDVDDSVSDQKVFSVAVQTVF